MASITRSRSWAAARKTKFSSLPTELRLMVWLETFQPRFLHISGEATNYTNYSNDICLYVYFTSHDPPPIALHVCRESRALALKHYIPSFHSVTYPDSDSEMKQTAHYFNPDLDTVRVVEEDSRKFAVFFLYMNQETIRSIKTLAIGGHLFQTKFEMRDFIAKMLSALESLETLILVVDDEGVSSIQMDMEDRLVKARDRFVLEGESKEWKLPAVQVIARAFEK